MILTRKDTGQHVRKRSKVLERNVPGSWLLELQWCMSFLNLGRSDAKYPEVSLRKLKARIRVRGDSQIKGVDYLETFAPVVNWNTVCLMLILPICLIWQQSRLITLVLLYMRKLILSRKGSSPHQQNLWTSIALSLLTLHDSGLKNTNKIHHL